MVDMCAAAAMNYGRVWAGYNDIKAFFIIDCHIIFVNKLRVLKGCLKGVCKRF